MEKDLNKEITVKAYNPSVREREVWQFTEKRIREMKEYRKNLKVEKEWQEADKEYIPERLQFSSSVHFEADQETGLRSRLVKVGGDENSWRSDNSDPTLLVKIQTALSIIIDRNPEIVLTALLKKYEKTAPLMNALWKRNWEITNSKETLKLFAFNLAKYGWSVGRSFPKLFQYDKEILVESSGNEKKYETKTLTLFNDVARENLDPYRTWIDEMTKPYESFSMNDCYYELDYSYDQGSLEFSDYKNWNTVLPGVSQTDIEKLKQDEDDKGTRKDILTVGFYENRLKDLYVICIPKQGIVLYEAPLPNDEGNLSLWHTMWVLRDAKNPYGISLWKILQQDKELYDKMSNMTMDQLVLSVMKMFFYTGASNLFGDGKINIVPGKGVQITNGKVDWMEVPGPGAESWKGLQYIKSRMDDNSGITPTLEGQVTGKTLGEILHAKEAALKRLRAPIENISTAIEQDAYLTLSWMSQIYSTPEVKDFTDEQKLKDYEEAEGVQHHQLFLTETNPETGLPEGLQATFMPELSLHLEDRSGQLFESKESRFFQVGKDIKENDLKWRGIIRVLPKSLLSPSAELEKQRKLELFNIIAPLLPTSAEIFGKAVRQIIKINEEDPEDWLPDSWLEQKTPSLFVNAPQAQGGMPQPGGGGQGIAEILKGAIGGQSMQGAMGITPFQGAQTVVPQGQNPMGNIPSITSNIPNMMTPKLGV